MALLLIEQDPGHAGPLSTVCQLPVARNEWILACSIACAQRSPLLVRDLLSGMKRTLTIHLQTPASAAQMRGHVRFGGFGMVGVFGGNRTYTGEVASEPVWQLVSNPSPGDVVALLTPHLLYTQRRLVHFGEAENMLRGYSYQTDTTEMRIAWLSQLLGADARTALEPETTVVYHTRHQTFKDAEAKVAARCDAWRRLLDDAQAQHLLAPADRLQLPATFTLTLDDELPIRRPRSCRTPDEAGAATGHAGAGIHAGRAEQPPAARHPPDVPAGCIPAAAGHAVRGSLRRGRPCPGSRTSPGRWRCSPERALGGHARGARRGHQAARCPGVVPKPRTPATVR